MGKALHHEAISARKSLARRLVGTIVGHLDAKAHRPREARKGRRHVAGSEEAQGGRGLERLDEGPHGAPAHEAVLARGLGRQLEGKKLRMARAEVLIGINQMDPAIKILQDVVKSSGDRQTMALAHNTLGECLYKSQKYAEARWEFLFVDTIYNQDKSQHAKALYYLWKTFGHLNDGERGQQCRTLLDGPQFAGTEFQKLAKAQSK